MLSGQSTKTNKVASDVTNEARVVKSIACVGWHGIALLVADWPSIRGLSGGNNQMTN